MNVTLREIECLICQAKTARNHYEIEDCLDLIDDMREALERMMKKTVWIPGIGYKEYEDGAGWQPIETAPKKRLMLLYFPAIKPERRGALGLNEMFEVGYPDGFPFRRPTHWMPLPEPPSE